MQKNVFITVLNILIKVFIRLMTNTALKICRSKSYTKEVYKIQNIQKIIY